MEDIFAERIRVKVLNTKCVNDVTLIMNCVILFSLFSIINHKRKEIEMNYLYIIIPVAIIFLAGIRIVRPTQRGLIERLGKYFNFANPGFHWIIPIIDRLYMVNVTEQMIDAEPQEIITNDNLNASVDAQVYFRVKADEESDWDHFVTKIIP